MATDGTWDRVLSKMTAAADAAGMIDWSQSVNSIARARVSCASGAIRSARTRPDAVRGGYCHLKQWRGLATRYDKHAIIYRAAVGLNAALAWTRALLELA